MLQAHENVMDHVAYPQDVILVTAHAQRPLIHASQAINQVHRLLSDLIRLLHPVGEGSTATESMALGADHLDCFAYTAAADASACMARLNADALCHLLAVWLDTARFPTSVKGAVKRDPLAPGVAPHRRTWSSRLLL